MLNVDQNSWEPIQTFLVEQERQDCQPAVTTTGDSSQATPEQVPALNARNVENVTNVHVKPKTSETDQTSLDNGPMNIIRERHEEAMQEFVAVGTDDKTGRDMEITGSSERKGTPENGGQPEPRFGAGFPNTPRQRKKTEEGDGGAAST